MSTLNPNDFDVRFGRHSNIPDCCIEYFIGEWQEIWPDRWKSKKFFDGYPEVGYVACPKCRQDKTFVTIHICTEQCEIFLFELRLKMHPDYTFSEVTFDDSKEMFI